MMAESGAQLSMCGPDAKAEASPGRSGAPSSAGDLQPRLLLQLGLWTLYILGTQLSMQLWSPPVKEQ